MRSRGAIVLAAALALAAPRAASQIASIVGPQVAPIGVPVAISISNDSATPVITVPCPYQIRNAHGVVIYAPLCPAPAVPLNPGATFTSFWPQIAANGHPVLPGAYTVDVLLPAGMGTQSFPVTIGGAVSSVAPLGVPKIGTTRSYQLVSPLDPGALYLMAASGSSTTGIPTCGGTLPLDPDALFSASLSDPTVFQNTFGTLDASGVSSAPTIAIPNLPGLVGLNVSFAMIVLDFATPCPFRSISAPMKVTIG